MSKNDLYGIIYEEIGTVLGMQRAFDAALSYEKNCRAKYDRYNLPSLPIPKGEQMIDFAMQYGTTIREMKKHELQVDKLLGSNF
jgi:hypothetical protein